jgi:hypothetical protein
VRDSGSPLDAWMETNHITNLMDDCDHDGMNELLEYAFDRNPAVPDVFEPIRLKKQPSQNLHAEFEVYVSSTAAGVFYHVKASNTPDRAGGELLGTFTSEEGNSGYLTVTDIQPIALSNTRFAWVEIEVPSDP